MSIHADKAQDERGGAETKGSYAQTFLRFTSTISKGFVLTDTRFLRQSDKISSLASEYGPKPRMNKDE
ncbi:hypothetical protein E2C01_086209 [Portunus trituberculatus]|uniref:Uncharacterized protein n=1 Tax=Portunus trituberculatus TaxID=210409 RepID=A0A5B7J366_PORTR|nr:hypothetical protein [Portunus trituberculatus]